MRLLQFLHKASIDAIPFRAVGISTIDLTANTMTAPTRALITQAVMPSTNALVSLNHSSNVWLESYRI